MKVVIDIKVQLDRDFVFQGTPDAQLNPKKKIFEQVQPELLTDANGVATYRNVPWSVVGKGICRSQTLKNTIIK